MGSYASHSEGSVSDGEVLCTREDGPEPTAAAADHEVTVKHGAGPVSPAARPLRRAAAANRFAPAALPKGKVEATLCEQGCKWLEL